MGKHTGPSCRQCRREGERLMLKGERCNSQKCSLAKRNTPPGMHGAITKKMSDYAIRLREKQKLRRIYGISEKQLRAYFDSARKSPGVTGNLMLQFLERRMDNVIFKLGLAASRKQARQLVKHAHFLVNGKRVDIPSYPIKPKDIVSIKERSQKTLDAAIQKTKEARFPSWISFNPDKKEGVVVSLPTREDIEYPISEQLIVEFYAR